MTWPSSSQSHMHDCLVFGKMAIPMGYRRETIPPWCMFSTMYVKLRQFAVILLSRSQVWRNLKRPSPSWSLVVHHVSARWGHLYDWSRHKYASFLCTHWTRKQVLAKDGIHVRGISRKGTPREDATFTDYLSADPCNPNEEVMDWHPSFVSENSDLAQAARFISSMPVPFWLSTQTPRSCDGKRVLMVLTSTWHGHGCCGQVLERVRSASVIVSCVPPGPCVKALEVLSLKPPRPVR